MPAEEVAAADERASHLAVPFDGLTPDWRLRGTMLAQGRLSDALNRREEVELRDVEWAPADGSGPFEPAPGIKVLDPYDLVLILAGPETLPHMTEAEKAAHKVHKVPFDVALEVPPFRVVGTIMLHPGSDPSRLQDRSMPMFVPLLNAVGFLEGREIASETPVSAILVNRFYLRSVDQVELATAIRLARISHHPPRSSAGARGGEPTAADEVPFEEPGPGG